MVPLSERDKHSHTIHGQFSSSTATIIQHLQIEAPHSEDRVDTLTFQVKTWAWKSFLSLESFFPPEMPALQF